MAPKNELGSNRSRTLLKLRTQACWAFLETCRSRSLSAGSKGVAAEPCLVNETDVLCGEENVAAATDSEGNRVHVWTWTAIDADNDLEMPRPSDSPERTVALRMLASIPNTGSRGVYWRDINYFMNWWQADYAPVLLSQSHGDPRTPVGATRADLEQYLIHLASLEEPIAAATINRRIAVVASFYNRAIDDTDILVELLQ